MTWEIIKDVLGGVFIALLGYGGVICMAEAAGGYSVTGIYAVLLFIVGLLMFLPLAMFLAGCIADVDAGEFWMDWFDD